MDEPTVASVQLQPGEKLFGRYVLERKLGQGGMGVVWLARDESLQRLTALKFLPDVVRQDHAAVDDLREETRRSLELTHPNIVRIYDFEEDARAAGISMEFVDGGSLSSVRSEKPQRMYEVDELLPLLRDLCAALHYAHTEARVVHRDLKPANLLVNSRGQLKITDFGIARTITDSVSRVTGRDATSGTLLYMSPQQFLGKPSAPSDDIYSVGATVYELLTSKPPFFTGSVAAQLHAATPPSMTERRREFNKTGQPIPDVWEEVIAACLAKDPEERPKSVREIYERIALGSSTKKPVPGADLSATPPPVVVPPPVPGSRQPVPPLPAEPRRGGGLGTLAVVGLFAMAAGVGGWFWKNHREPIAQATPTPVATPKLIAAAPTAGTLVVNSAPSGASIMLDGRLVGVTPWTRSDILPGSHRIRLVLEGYEPQELAAVVAAGETRDTGAVPLTAIPRPVPQQPPTIVINRELPPPRPLPPAPRPGDYQWLFPDSSIRRLDRSELTNLSKEDLWRARNEIYARHGFIFSTDRGRAFTRKLGRFYRPVSDSDTRVYQGMNPIEQANVELIRSLE